MQAMLALAMGTALLGIDVGWQPIEEGGLEYIVQIDPETLARLKPGDELATGIRPVLRDVRRYRIVIGKGPLPRIALPESPTSSSGRSEPRPAPVPLAAAEPPHRSILVPAERGSAAPPASTMGVAPFAPAEPRGGVVAVPPLSPTPIAIPELKPATSTVPPADRTAARTRHPFDALPDAAARSLPESPKVPAAAAAPERDWKAPAALTVPGVAPKSVPPPATLKLNDALDTPPVTIPKTAPKAELQPTPKAESQPPAINLGERYRDAERYPPADRHPVEDRYRDFAPPASSQPKAAPLIPPPAKAPEDRSTDNAANPESRLTGQSQAPATEFVGPILPPQEKDRENPALKSLARRPEVAIVDNAKVDRVSKTPPLIPPAAIETKPPPVIANSRLLADNFGQKPASLVNDPSVRPVSAEPAAATAPSLPASAAKPAAPVPTPTESAPRPWLPLTLALFTLFASLGGNIFLGWVAHDTRARYGLLLRENRSLTA